MARRTHPSQSHPPAERPALPVLPLRDAVHFPGLINTVHVARERSLKAVRSALQSDRRILVLSQKDMGLLDPSESELHSVGVLSELLQASPFPDGSMRVILRGLSRAEAQSIREAEGGFEAVLAELKQSQSAAGVAPLLGEARDAFAQFVAQSETVPPEAAEGLAGIATSGLLADHIAHFLPLALSEKQQVLEELDADARLEWVYVALRREGHLLRLRDEIRSRADAQIAESQREYVMREQLRALQKELFGSEGCMLSRPFRSRLQDPSIPDEIRAVASEHLARLERLADDSPEAAVVAKHLECLLDLPWRQRTTRDLDLGLARRELEQAHLGMREVKDRILEFLAVMKLTRNHRSTILCFEGPPGVGKTSLAKSIAEILGRSLLCVSLGGVRDEAELRGHRRTYVGSQPGRIIQGLIACGNMNPVCLLDEIDKVTFEGSRSDVASALLEILDPTLNRRFRDHFLDVPLDLSEFLFIATANSVGSLPPALRDRMEVISFSSYSGAERVAIAREHLYPSALRDHGLTRQQLQIEEDAFEVLVRTYSRESGVRQLERLVANLCRKSALSIASGARKRVRVTAENLAAILGNRPLHVSSPESRSSGSAVGLVVAAYGGDAMEIEAALLEPLAPTPEVKLTGNMGNVMQESAETAVSFLRSGKLPWIPQAGFAKDIHIHAAQSDRAKEGPSAGLAIAVAIASALTDRQVSPALAITGEISLLGKVLPVGGIREKLLAAHRLGYKMVMMPAGNVGEIEFLPRDVREGLSFHPVATVSEALEEALKPTASSSKYSRMPDTRDC